MLIPILKNAKKGLIKENNINYSEKELNKFKTACKNIYLISKKKFVIRNKKIFKRYIIILKKYFMKIKVLHIIGGSQNNGSFKGAVILHELC